MKKTQMIILAGGSGERFGGEIPKQFVKIAGKTIIEHTIEKAERCRVIDSVVVVVSEKYYEYMNELVLRNRYHKTRKVIAGGESRQESSYAGILACDEDTDYVLFHDAIRPFVSERILFDIVEALERYEAVDVAIPCADTIIRVNDKGLIDSIPERRRLMRGQTPQGFRLDLIRRAYEKYRADGSITVTDDCGIVEKYGLADIYVVEGEEQNIKVTYREDAYLADKLFQIHSMELVGGRSFAGAAAKLKDKVGIVIGHTSGIGRDVYELMKAENGVIYGFSKSAGMDVASLAAVEGAFRSVSGKEGRIDYVINTSGILSIGKLECMNEKEIETMILTNYLGSVNVVRAAAPYLRETRGSVVLFTSSSYTRGRAMYSIYSSTKAAIVNFAQAVSEELYGDGVRINVMNPERTDTPMRRKNFGAEPAGTLLDSRLVAEETLKTAALDITGQVVDVRRR